MQMRLIGRETLWAEGGGRQTPCCVQYAKRPTYYNGSGSVDDCVKNNTATESATLIRYGTVMG